MGHLDRIEVENFKSYAGTQVIGPFRDFTAIIGPNGSGKSNLMDAISFVLGVQSRQLRSSQMKELIFRADDAAPGKRRASVMLVYKVSDSDDLEGYKAGDEVHFKRTISATGVGAYKIDDKDVTAEVYDKTLKQIGVLVKARNFLVFQGDVESIAQKAPREMSLLIEQISGSEDLREEYEEAKKVKEEAEEETIFAYQKRKGLAAERRLVKEQKEEAERFQAKTAELAALTTESFLFQLNMVKHEMEEHQERIDGVRNEMKEAETKEAELEEQVKVKKTELAQIQKEVNKADKEVGKRKHKAEDFAPAIIKENQVLENLKKKLHDEKTSGLKLREDLVNQKENIKGLTGDLEKVTKALAAKEEEFENIKAEQIRKGVVLSEEKYREYQALKQKVAGEATKEKSALDSLTRQQKSDEAQREQKSRELALHEDTVTNCEQGARQQEDRASGLRADFEKTEEERKKLEKEMKAAEKDMEKTEARLAQVKEEIRRVEDKLREYKAERRQNQAEERMAAALEAMKQLFPGVKGRVLDLCRPTSRKWNLAVTVAGGKLMEAVVVNTKQTASECIRYLREQRTGVCTFIPLDSVRVKDVVERYRSLGNKYRLAIDCLTYEDEVRQAILFAVGSTVICDTLNDARHLCFTKNEKAKAVTVDGYLISKDGTMTGGQAEGDDSRGAGGRWDDREVADLKKRREELLAEQAELTRGSRREEVKETRNRIEQLKSRAKSAQTEIAVCDKRAKDQQVQKAKAEEQATILKKELKELEDKVTKRAAAIEEKQGVMDGIEDRVFASFCKEMKLDNIREYESKAQKIQLKFEGELDKLRNQESKMTAQLELEKSRDFETPLKKAIEKVKKLKEDIKACEEKQEEMKEKEVKLQESIKEAEEALSTVKAKYDEHQKAVKVAGKEKAAMAQTKADVAKRVTHEEAALERIRAKLHEVLTKARMEQVKLPLLDGEEEEDEEEEESQSQTQSQATGSKVGDSTHPSQSQNPVVMREKITLSKVDLSKLKRNNDVREGTKAADDARKRYKQQITELQGELEKMQPNLRALDRYEELSKRVKEASEEFEKCKTTAQAATLKYNNVRAKRYEAFMSCFDAVSESLTGIYKDMTRSSKHPLGGQASLSLDDSDEPYNGGIKYNAMPPMKRFRDMDHLSGGEKTVAALALLFAIHSYRPAPFFVMDEVDAALDNVNVRKVCNYIKSRSGEFQCIVISLKDMFYENANALVGICRDAASNGSCTLTLDLDQFDEPHDEEEEEEEEEEQENGRGSPSRGGGYRRAHKKQ